MRIRLEEVLLRLLKSGFHFYIIGIVILTFGIALSIQSTLGTSPFDALLVGLHRTIGLTIGSWEIVVGFAMVLGNAVIRSEEHTSELQSRGHLVCRLLLEKKKRWKHTS